MEKIFKEKKRLDLVNGNLKKDIFRFALPIMFSGILQQLYNQADLMVCGNFGSKYSVGAISATGSISYLLICLLIGLSVGSNALVSNALGSKDKEKAKRIIGTSLFFGFVSSLIISVLGYFISERLLILMNTSIEILPLSTKYMQIIFIGLPFNLIYNFGAALLRGMGDSKKPFYYLTSAGVVNVLLNLLFVIVFKMDVEGVAIATIVAQAISAILVVITLMKGNLFARFELNYFRIYKNEFFEIVKVGLPAGIQGSFFSISNVLIQSSINAFGPVANTGVGAASSIETYLNTIQNSFGQTCIAFVAANLGSSNYKRIKESTFWCLLYGVAISLALGVVVNLFKTPLLSLFTKDEESIAIGSKKILIICSVYFIYAITDCLPYASRGMGYSTVPMFVSLIGICLIRVLFILFVFPLDQFHSLEFLFFTYPLSWVFTALAHFICYLIFLKKTKERLLA